MSLGSKRSFGLMDPVCRHRAVFWLADLLTAEVLIADRAAWSALIAAVPATLTKVRLALVLRAVLAVLLGVSVTVEGGRPMLEGAADSLPLVAASVLQDRSRFCARSNPAAMAANGSPADRSLGAIAPSEADGLEW